MVNNDRKIPIKNRVLSSVRNLGLRNLFLLFFVFDVLFFAIRVVFSVLLDLRHHEIYVKVIKMACKSTGILLCKKRNLFLKT